MIIKRKVFLALAGVGEQAFKSLQRRDQVPMLGRAGIIPMDDVATAAFHERVDGQGYLPIEAIMLALADELASTASFSRDEARRSVEGHPNIAIDGVRRALAGETIFAGFYTTQGCDDASSDDIRQAALVRFAAVGTRAEVLAQIDADAAGWGDHVRTVTLVNLTLIVRRAEEVRGTLGVANLFTKEVE